MTLPTEVLQRAEIWDAAAIKYMIIGFGLLALSIISSAAVTVFTDGLSTAWIKIFSFVAAASTALLTAFNPIDVGYRFREAWRELDHASLQHKVNPDKFTIEMVIEAMAKGEAIIQNGKQPLLIGAKGPTEPAAKKASDP